MSSNVRLGGWKRAITPLAAGLVVGALSALFPKWASWEKPIEAGVGLAVLLGALIALTGVTYDVVDARDLPKANLTVRQTATAASATAFFGSMLAIWPLAPWGFWIAAIAVTLVPFSLALIVQGIRAGRGYFDMAKDPSNTQPEPPVVVGAGGETDGDDTSKL
ncbi:hypothetical protein [Microbacterium sp. 77mftsu3.1]|uniref:hypothetical protein n=1 Tax=Microbacterium sp. 77mftsu3.1 TaxID=1761802 RepID=UPI00115F9A24|nr:hypothetical protein [Microbacterium sp. 77mftsu3.1]